jgi:glycosyltransferase involved in cell wall biosynthesis
VNLAYVITRADAVGGASIHVRDLARAMLDRGHRATVLIGGRGPVTDLLANAGIPYRSLRFLQPRIHPLRDLRAIAEIGSVLRGLQPDLVSTHTAKAGWVGRAACARLGLPAIYTPHGWSIGRRISGPLGVVFSIAEKAAANWCNAIICVCEEERRLALSKGIAAAEKLHVVYNGVRDVPAGVRANPASSPVRICSIARFESPKDHRTLLQALAMLRSEPWALDLVGDGPLEAETRGLAAELGLAGRVDFLGYQTEPARALAGAQLFALSSRSEGFPRSVLEAMRAGLPVVASDVGGVGEAVAEGVSGLLVPRESPEALSAALGRLIADPALRQRMGVAGRSTFESRFGFESMVEKTAAMYATVLERTARTRTSA